MTQKQTLEQWINGWQPKYRPIVRETGAIGIHDTPDIDHGRTWLFGLSDYVVSSVSGGVIWLVPRERG
jgi:hypothetical protein